MENFNNSNQQKKKSAFFPSMWKFMFVILFLVATNSFGQLLNENFEGGFPAGWTETNNNGYPWSLYSGVSAYGVGNNSINVDFYDWQSGTEQLNSVLFPATSSGYYLQFDESYAAFPGGYDDQLEILYSTDGGTTFNSLILLDGGDHGPLNTGGDNTNYFVPNSSQWQTMYFQLPVGTNMIQFNAITAYGNELYMDNIQVLIPTPCSGTPNAGTASASDAMIGQNIPFTLSAAGADNGFGITYQWQSSPDNINYTDISGANTIIYTASGTSDTWYRLAVTCSSNSNFSYSIPVFVQVVQNPWIALNNTAPDGASGPMTLMSDGTILCKTWSGAGYGDIFDKLTPDANGSYQNGTWTRIAPMITNRFAFSSCVMMDGRFYCAGGEYGADGFKHGYHAETYNPLTNTWTAANGADSSYWIGDSNCELLENGNILDGTKFGNLRKNLIYDTPSNTLTHGPDCLHEQDEAMWLKLPDNSILFVSAPVDADSNYVYQFQNPIFIYDGSTHSERYIQSLNQWIAEPDVPVELYEQYAFETGPAFLLPDGRAFFFGSTSHTAYYTPSGNNGPGSWAAGPDMPNGLGCPDAAGAMMVDGKIVFTCSATPSQGNGAPSPAYLYEFDYLTNTFTQLLTPQGTASMATNSQSFSLLNLPDGSVLCGGSATGTQYYIYHPVGAPLDAGKPHISNITQNACTNYTIRGTGFNGITEGSAFGDEMQSASNYPIVRLTSGSNVYYAHTYEWNSAGVMRGSLTDSTHFTLPAGIPVGTYSVVVVANGNASDPVTFTVNANPLPVIAGLNVICNNTATTLSSPGYASYMWSNSAVTPSIQAMTTGTYSVTVTDVHGCTGTSSTVLTASYILIPVISGNVPFTICQGNSITLSTTPYATYHWSNGGTGSSTTVNTGGLYTVAVSNAAGCTAIGQRTVTVAPSPMPNITGTGITTYCSGGPATLTVQTYSQYLWSTGAVTQSVGIPANTPGTYSVTVTNTSGCHGNASIVLNNACTLPGNLSTGSIAATTAVINWTQPACVYGYIIRISKHNANSWTPHTITPNTHYTFSQLSHNTTYDWQIETICNAAQTSVSGFSATQTFTTAPRLENGETGAMDYAFNVYPNPTNDHATIAFTSDKEEVYTLRLLDVTGRIVLSANNTSVTGENLYQMDLSSIAKGIYTVILQNGDAVLQSKIVVQ